MERRHKKIFFLIMLFSLTLSLTNSCVAMLLYPTTFKPAEPKIENHLDCGNLSEAPVAEINLAAANAGSNLLPCCVGQNQNNNSARLSAEKPLALIGLALAPAYHQTLPKISAGGYSGEPWLPPERTIIDSIIIRI